MKKYNKILSKYKVPNNCRDCLELFTVQGDNRIKFCNKFMPKKKLSEFKDRNEIYAEFKKNRREPKEMCKKCKYFIRGQCNGLCQIL